MQELWKQLPIEQKPSGDFLPADLCVQRDTSPQLMAAYLENLTNLIIKEYKSWHELAKETTFFEENTQEQYPAQYKKEVGALLKAKRLFHKQAKTSYPLSLTAQQRDDILFAREIAYNTLPTFGLWQSVDVKESEQELTGLPEKAIPAVQVALVSLVENFIEKVCPMPKKVMTHTHRESTQDHQRSSN